MYYLFIIAAVLSTGLTGLLLVFLRRLKAWQVEREEGPASHKQKSGTPTLGGIGFLLTVIILLSAYVDLRYLPVLFLTVAFASIGLIDDILKIVRKQNLGLSFWQKIILQTMVAAIFAAFILGINNSLIPVYFWIVIFIFWTFIVVGAANATNLTDGLDGLLAGCALLTFLSYAFICAKGGWMGGAALAFIFAGALLGFLIFNFPKARLFMGDVGSLSIGAALAGLTISLGREWLLALVGGVFVAEALSVIIQVASYKLYKKRIFKMAPLHHHFELSGLSELQVVVLFWLVQLILSVLGVILA